MQSKASQLRARGRAARGKKRTASEAFESSSKKNPPQQGCKPYSERGGKRGGGRGGGADDVALVCLREIVHDDLEHEAIELRDGDSNRYLGKGVAQAVENVAYRITVHITGTRCI